MIRLAYAYFGIKGLRSGKDQKFISFRTSLFYHYRALYNFYRDDDVLVLSRNHSDESLCMVMNRVQFIKLPLQKPLQVQYFW